MPHLAILANVFLSTLATSTRESIFFAKQGIMSYKMVMPLKCWSIEDEEQSFGMINKNDNETSCE